MQLSALEQDTDDETGHASGRMNDQAYAVGERERENVRPRRTTWNAEAEPHLRSKLTSSKVHDAELVQPSLRIPAGKSLLMSERKISQAIRDASKHPPHPMYQRIVDQEWPEDDEDQESFKAHLLSPVVRGYKMYCE